MYYKQVISKMAFFGSISRILIFPAIVLNSVGGVAQSYNAMSFPSPNNSFLGGASVVNGKSDVGVDLFTGMASVKIPLFTLPSRKLNIPITLSYIGGRGIKVQDYASSTGLGWNLDAGGSVSRVVRGFPDELANGYLGTGHWGQLVATAGINNTAMPSQTNSYPPTADGEPDMFYVKTPFFAFQFSFDGNGSPVFSNYEGFQVITKNFYNTVNYASSSFEVIDDKGNQFYFGSTLTSVESSTNTIYGTSYNFPSTWYLDKIIAFGNQDFVTFDYQSAPNNDVQNHYQGTYTTNGTQYQYDTTHPSSVTFTPLKYVKTIVSTLGEVDFTYAFDRRDDLNAGRLTSVVIKGLDPVLKTNSVYLQTFGFNYSYFGDPSSDPDILRLKLDYINLSGNTTATAVPITFRSFAYNTPAMILPTRRTLNWVDYWGYFNFGPFNAGNFPNNYRGSYSSASVDVLTGITDLSGSSTTLSYEGNDYYNSSTSSNVYVGGLRVNRISRTLPSGDNLYTTYSYLDASNKSTGLMFGNTNGSSTMGSYANVTFNIFPVTLILSEAASEIYDLNGISVGYSSVKETDQNGGWTISTFTNADAFPDAFNYLGGNMTAYPNISSSISSSYKRGLLLDKTTYNSVGSKITSDTYNYAAQLTPVGKNSWAYKWFSLNYNVGGISGYFYTSSKYWTNVEDYNLAGITHKDFDQITPANFVSKTTSLVYNADKHLIYSETSTDSKGQSLIKTYYHTQDPSIPNLVGNEQSILYNAGLQQSNFTNFLAHEVDNRNGYITQLHNTLSNTTLGSFNANYVSNTSKFVGSNLADQRTYNYDMANLNVISSSSNGGINTSSLTGYNSSYEIAKVSNTTASSTVGTTTNSNTQYLTYPTGNFSFTIAGTGTATIGISFGGYPGATNLTTATYNLTGPSNQSGNLCYTMAGSGYTCSYPSSITFSNLPPGNYTLSTTETSNFPSSSPNTFVTYTSQTPSFTYTNESFYESFEEGTSGTAGAAHSGNRYLNGSYTTSYAPPNGRSYTIQYWTLSSGNWVFHQQIYSNGTVLAGPIDDIRIFPSDAMMTTYTYRPLVGKTSQIDPGGLMQTYEYDGLSRLNIVRDQNNNIIRKYDYQYGYVQNATINAVSTVANTFKITYSDVTTGVTYIQTLPANGNFSLGNVPTGTYNITISPFTYSSISPLVYTFNGSTQTYYAAVSYGNVAISGSVSITVAYPPTAGIYAANTIGTNCAITFKNTVTNIVYNFTSTSGGGALFLGSVPNGTYDITISPNTYSSSSPNIYRVYYYTQTYYAAVVFGGVAVSSSCSITIDKNL